MQFYPNMLEKQNNSPITGIASGERFHNGSERTDVTSLLIVSPLGGAYPDEEIAAGKGIVMADAARFALPVSTAEVDLGCLR